MMTWRYRKTSYGSHQLSSSGQVSGDTIDEITAWLEANFGKNGERFELFYRAAEFGMNDCFRTWVVTSEIEIISMMKLKWTCRDRWR